MCDGDPKIMLVTAEPWLDRVPVPCWYWSAANGRRTDFHGARLRAVVRVGHRA
jgi:hypothetical protein